MENQAAWLVVLSSAELSVLGVVGAGRGVTRSHRVNRHVEFCGVSARRCVTRSYRVKRYGDKVLPIRVPDPAVAPSHPVILSRKEIPLLAWVVVHLACGRHDRLDGRLRRNISSRLLDRILSSLIYQRL